MPRKTLDGLPRELAIMDLVARVNTALRWWFEHKPQMSAAEAHEVFLRLLDAAPAQARASHTGACRRMRAGLPRPQEPPLVLAGARRQIEAVAGRRRLRYTLNHMVQSQTARLDASFAALADATRRGVLEQLERADASITELAEKFRMTLTGMKKHVGVLKRAGLVVTEKVGRVRTCRLGQRDLAEEAAWIERHRRLWAARFDELDKVVEELKRKESRDGRRKR